MMINDPLSDMIARIRNAHMRKRSKVLTPASRLRQRVLDVLQDEGYIRGYALVQNPGEFPQFEIELKYFDGQPVIAEIARVSKPPRLLRDLRPEADQERPRHLDPLHVQGRHVGHRGSRSQGGRRSPLQGLLRCPVSENAPLKCRRA